MSTTRLPLIQDQGDCPCMGGTLDRLLQPAMLAVLAKGPLHGYQLAKRIGAMAGFAGPDPDMSGVYRFLKTMEGKGLVVSAWDLAEAGPAKRSYQITPAGRRCLRLWIETLEEYRKGIARLLKVARSAIDP